MQLVEGRFIERERSVIAERAAAAPTGVEDFIAWFEALKAMGRADLIGNGKQHLIPRFQPLNTEGYTSSRRKNSTSAAAKTSPVTQGRVKAAPGKLLTQHTGLPPKKTR